MFDFLMEYCTSKPARCLRKIKGVAQHVSLNSFLTSSLFQLYTSVAFSSKLITETNLKLYEVAFRFGVYTNVSLRAVPAFLRSLSHESNKSQLKNSVGPCAIQLEPLGSSNKIRFRLTLFFIHFLSANSNHFCFPPV